MHKGKSGFYSYSGVVDYLAGRLKMKTWVKHIKLLESKQTEKRYSECFKFV